MQTLDAGLEDANLQIVAELYDFFTILSVLALNIDMKLNAISLTVKTWDTYSLMLLIPPSSPAMTSSNLAVKKAY